MKFKLFRKLNVSLNALKRIYFDQLFKWFIFKSDKNKICFNFMNLSIKALFVSKSEFKRRRKVFKLLYLNLGLCPETPSYYGNRAACYMMLGQHSRALEDAKTSVQVINTESSYG